VEKAPQAEVVAVGPVINSVSTDIGSLNYKAKLTMWATAYDAHCSGCNGLTATGQKTGYGVVAVDPNIIPLGTKLYIPGYGQAVAGDTGGSIKGNKIDLGFDNVALSGWYSHFVEVYIL
jgi:3D (Asp-Asp-Asp) domain-containing protein